MKPRDRSTARLRKPRMNQGTNRLQDRRIVASVAPRPATSERPITTGPSISTRTSFTRVPSWVLIDAHRQGRGENLRHRIDGQSGQHAVLRERQPEDRHQQRQGEHDDDAEDRGERDGGGDILRLCADHGRNGGDGGVAADRVAAGDQHRHAPRQAEPAAEP